MGCLLPSCSKEPEDGTIADVVIDQPVPDDDADTIFTKTDSPYDYEYTTFTIKKAHMRFDVPASWDVRVDNARHIVMQTPVDDLYLPDATINILCNYGENVDENEFSQYTLNDHAYNFSAYFQDELAGLITRTDGITRHLRKYEAEDEIYNGLEFVDKAHAQDAATLVANNVVLVDETYRYYPGEYGMVTTFIKWDHSPFCFNAIVKQEDLEHARAMIEHIVSSVSYEKSDPEGYKEVKYKREFSTWVPNSFEPVTGAEHTFRSYLGENRETAGMAIGVFSINDVTRETINADVISKNFGQTIAGIAFSGYSGLSSYGVQVQPSSEEDGPDFSGPLFVDCTTYSDPVEIAGSSLGPYAYYYADYYVVEKDDQDFLIAVIYQDCQKVIARAAGKTAVRKLSVL